MKANYHTHTWRCNHADGTEREYVERAIEGGYEILGFSDHSPYPFPEEYHSGIRMRVDQLEDYVDTVLSLKKEYQKDIEIHLGLEAEYYPAYFDRLLALVADYPVEYFLLAQHCLGNEVEGIYSSKETTDPAVLRRYCDQVIEGMETGCFTYLAHPDIIHFVGDPAVYEEQMRRFCRSAKAHDLPMEINFLGIYENRHYPNEALWKIAGEEGCSVIFGADAHHVKDVVQPRSLLKAQALVEKYGLKLEETAKLVRPVRK